MDGLSSEGSNIVMAFYNGTLFGIKVYWEADPQDLLRLGTQNFGESRVFRYTNYNRALGRNVTSEYRLWSVGGRDIFWGNDIIDRFNGKYFIYIDQQSHRNYIEDTQRETQRREAEEQRRRQENASNVQL
jgi:hypothetical protein